MEKSTEEATGSGYLQPAEGVLVRRRLIQSTLFPHRPQDNAGTECEYCDKEENQEDEEEEFCESQTKKKRKRRPKAVSKPRAKKDAVNCKETICKTMDDADSPVIDKSEFFLKVSERRHQKRKQKGQLFVGSPEDNDKICSLPDLAAEAMKSPWQRKHRASATPEKPNASSTPENPIASSTPENPIASSTPENPIASTTPDNPIATPVKRRSSATPVKRLMNTTPKKNLVNSESDEACPEMLNSKIQSEHTSQPIPDLRLEAKMTAEENSRIFGGRQIHPFFSSWKMGKRSQEKTDEDRKWCSVNKRDESVAFSPIHVFEEVQDDNIPLDWGNWAISERSFLSISSGLESACTPIYEGSVKPLYFDNFLSTSHLTRTSFCLNDGSSAQSPLQLEDVSLYHSPLQGEHLPAISSTILFDEQGDHCEISRERQVNYEIRKFDSFLEHTGCGQSSDVGCHDMFLQKRIMAYDHGCDNQPANSLWTNKYQPKKSIEVCGNGDCVKILSEWLCLWHEKGHRTSKNFTTGVQDGDYNCCASESDSEDIDDESRLKNVLFVTGPVGSGKSAAIYACAKERGFQVIEVNASDWRNGALVKQRFGEAVESHWLQGGMENPENSDIKHFLKSFPATRGVTATQGTDNEVTVLVPLSDEYSRDTMMMPRKSVSKENEIGSDQSGIKTLILFEDVDATIYEDRGFIATIRQLAETAKRPMIITSNSSDSILPNNLDRLEVCFTIPSVKELFCLVNMICSAEKSKLHPCLVERFIRFCQGDMRKIIMLLQFWCQGQSYRKGGEVKGPYGQVVFDLDAAHRILPKMISYGYPSQLSEAVEKEITKSLLTVKETSSLPKIVEEDELENNELMMYKDEKDSIEAKREVMLSRHCSDQDGMEFTAHFGTVCEFSNSSGSPITFSRRNGHRRTDAVLSSDSGEDCLSSRFPVVPGKLFEDMMGNEIHLEVNSKFPADCLATEKCFNPLTEQLLHCQGQREMLGKNWFPCSVTTDYSQFNDICKSVDESFVPESSFVAETELFPEAVSCEFVDVSVEAAFTSNNFPFHGTNMSKSPSGLNEIPEFLRNSFDIITESVQEEEEVADSHIECVDTVPREYQAMDECSRMNFSRRSKTKKPRYSMVSDVVQETWRKLRHCHMDLKRYATLEHKDAFKVLKLACGMSNLISEADMLLSDCQPLICDYLEPTMEPCEEPQSFSWYDDQLMMTSTISEHGMCFYAKDIAVVNSNVDSVSRVDLAWEMLASSKDPMALGRLVSQDKRRIQSLKTEAPKSGILSQSELALGLCSIVQSIVPSRSYLAMRGNAYHEYLSSLSQISRLDSSRSLVKPKQRRARVAQHYLSTGALSLSPEDISLLSQYNCYQKVSSEALNI